VTTSKGQEKVILNDIFRERVTLRSDEGETRLLTLAELRAEMGGERVHEATGEAEAFVSQVDDVPEEVIRLQDTVELPAWVPRSPDSPRQASSRNLPVAQTPPASPPHSERVNVTAEPEPDEDDAEETAEAPSTPGAAEARPERRRRRRGRRGGRRNRGPDRGGGGGNPGGDAGGSGPRGGGPA
jgi:ribonuclease E